MGQTSFHLGVLEEITELPEGEGRTTAWRQSLAALGSVGADGVPVPLEGINPLGLQKSVAWALSKGLFESMHWLSPALTGVALYELAAALPMGPERRELGRRVLQHLHRADANSFNLIAERLALGTKKGLTGPGIVNRIALIIDMPFGSCTGVESLCLALLSRPELERTWLTEAAIGALPSRRLAARLLEQAAHEALRRSSRRFGSVHRLFEQPSIRSAWSRLLSDREPLVWRHIASARGLLSQQIPAFSEEIEKNLDPSLTPTEWRRAAASLAATVAVNPDRAVGHGLQLLCGDLFRKDPGMAGAMVLGLSRASEIEPEAADALLVELIRAGGLDAIEALVQFKNEREDQKPAENAIEIARKRIESKHIQASSDDGHRALVLALSSELDPTRNNHRSLRDKLDEAILTFARQDVLAAHHQALSVLESVDEAMERLERCDGQSSEARQCSFGILRDLDRTLLETSSLLHLLALGPKADSSKEIEKHFQRLADWLVHNESEPLLQAKEVNHITLRLHRLRTLLHLVDAENPRVFKDLTQEKERRIHVTKLLLGRVQRDTPTGLRRVVAASAARACDALVREEVGELSDVLILVTDHVDDALDLGVMAEASMEPLMVSTLAAYARFVKGMRSGGRMASGKLLGMDGLHELIESLPVVAGTPRVEALRQALAAFTIALASIASVRSLSDLAAEGPASRMPRLANASVTLARLALGARRRCGVGLDKGQCECEAALFRIDTSVEFALRGDPLPLHDAVSEAIATLREELPLKLAELAEPALSRLLVLPLAHREEAPFILSYPTGRSVPPLPPWMPPSRILGGFYVLHPLGFGATSSVFAVCRSESRSQRNPTRFALKVPEYGGDVAHTLSEAEFFDLFRKEAGALLAVASHPNLAQLVTFDAGSTPRPILVMELVEGPTLQRLLDTRVIETPQACQILDGVAAGLESLHSVGIGHLDLKPANVIVRAFECSRQSIPVAISNAAQRPSRVPMGPDGNVISVLVDFGLAGRNLRPGCATAAYGAPEVWGHIPEDHNPLPMPTDVYAFACLVFETLTGEDLFPGDSLLGILSGHLTHGGNPQRLSKLKGSTVLSQLADLLRTALSLDPRDRCSITTFRSELASIDLTGYPWPIVDMESS